MDTTKAESWLDWTGKRIVQELESASEKAERKAQGLRLSAILQHQGAYPTSEPRPIIFDTGGWCTIADLLEIFPIAAAQRDLIGAPSLPRTLQ